MGIWFVKEVVCSDNVIAHPVPDCPYKLYTDASQYAVGGILAQEDEADIERPTHYICKQLNVGQRK